MLSINWTGYQINPLLQLTLLCVVGGAVNHITILIGNMKWRNVTDTGAVVKILKDTTLVTLINVAREMSLRR